MDLDSTPIAPPVLSETIVVKPDNQNNITKQNGNKQINFFIPDYVRYFLPSQSFMQCNVRMTGRGLPIPSPSAAFHSFWNTITCRDGLTNSHILDELQQYNTLVSQTYTTMKTDQLNNQRLMFEGLQPNDSYTNNLYWQLKSGGTTWASANSAAGAATTGINGSVVEAKQVQISTTLKTDLLSTDQFVPVNVLGGLNMQLQQEDFRRALEYTTGSLGVGFINGVCCGKQQLTDGTNCFDLATPGDGFVDGNLYELRVGTATGAICGYVVGKATSSPGPLTSVDWYCTSSTAIAPPTSVTGNLILVSPTGAANNATITMKANTIPLGKLRVASLNAPYFVDLAVGDPKDCIGGHAPADNQKFGNGTLRDPFRTLNPISKDTAGLSTGNQAPNDNNPFVVGDYIKVSNPDGSSQSNLGYITGFTKSDINNAASGTPMCRVYFQPDIPPITTGLGNNVAVSGLGPTAAVAGQSIHTYNFNTDGYVIYLEQVHRISGLTPAHISAVTYSPNLITNAQSRIDFTISDLEYHVKRVDMDKRIDDNDMALSRGSGYAFDLNSVTTSLNNVTNIVGPTNQAIALPNIKRALGILSIPLNQSEQFGVQYKSLVGDPTGNPVASGVALQQGMTNYQYNLGTIIGRQPYRAVPVEKYSFKNPLIQTGAVSELIKANDSFGFSTSCLQALGMNFAIGRALARPGQFFDIMSAGSIQLLANYENVSSGNKLFCHFIKHLRRINISGSGIMIEN